jgi:beta-mannosidase
MRKALFILGLLIFHTGLSHSQNHTDNTMLEIHSGWEFKSVDTLDWMPADVPGTVHTDLLANGVIEDPFYRTNEKEQQWIDKRDWEYKTTFVVPDELFSKAAIELQFEGLDTYAEVYLNGTLILEADNFFCQWKVPVKTLLQEGENELRILFQSPTRVGLQELEAWGYGLPAVNDQSENGEMGDKKVSVFTRKPGYHYGWDWGPRLVTSGIWGTVRLLGWDALKVRDVYYQQKKLDENQAELEVQVQMESQVAEEVEFQLLLNDELVLTQRSPLKKGMNQLSIPLKIEDPKWWWTFDLGEPYRYTCELRVLQDGRVHENQVNRIGLRTIELVQEKDAEGRSFYFRLNGVPIFGKGANYIPQDIFIPRVSDEQYRSMIQSAREANMNMLRVWGGGFYEKDVFYDLCDEMGILVWQDFMFACSMYPGNEAFLENVKLEAEENVQRLRNHPSIALWCGNNEIDVAWAQNNPLGGWGWKQRYNGKQRQEIWSAYDTVFHHILPQAVEDLSPDIAYWPSSPYAGEGEHASHTTSSGDIHYWGVWHGKEPFEDFQKYVGRFMSEYGFQSFPEFETVKRFTIPEDWDIESEVMAAHQRSGIGNLRIRQYMGDYYPVPEDFEDLLYVGQVLQAEGMKMGFEAHRRAMPYCMGSLYWQINDCWPVASWSGMDYYQNWKAMHYYAKKAFEPVLVSPFAEEGKVKVSVVSDRVEAIPAALELKISDFEGDVLWEKVLEKKIDPLVGSVWFEAPEKEILKRKDPKKVYLQARLRDEAGWILSENVFYFTEAKNLALPEPDIQYELKQEGSQILVQLTSDKLARNVRLSFEGVEGRFSDNYFDLLPGETKTVQFKPSDPGDMEGKKLVIKSLWEVY